MTIQQAATPGAMRRINGFVAVLWVVGIVSAVIMVASAVGRIGWMTTAGDPAPIGVDGSPAPIATADGEIWSGRGDSVIDLPADLLGRPIAVTLLDGDGSAFLTINDTAIDPDGFGYLAGTFAEPGQAPTIVATYEHSRLSIRTDGDWMVQIAPFDPEVIADPSASGVGDAVVLVTGAEANAIISADGEGDTPVWVDVLSLHGLEIAVTSEVRDSPIAFEWESSPYVLLVISVRDATSWTLDVLERAP